MGLGSGQGGPGASGGRGGWGRMLGVGAEGSVGVVRVGSVRCGRLELEIDQTMLLRCLCSVVGRVLVLGPWSVVALVLVVLGWQDGRCVLVALVRGASTR